MMWLWKKLLDTVQWFNLSAAELGFALGGVSVVPLIELLLTRLVKPSNDDGSNNSIAFHTEANVCSSPSDKVSQ